MAFLLFNKKSEPIHSLPTERLRLTPEFTVLATPEQSLSGTNITDMGTKSLTPQDSGKHLVDSENKSGKGILVTVSGLQVVQSPPPPAGKPDLGAPTSAPSSSLKALAKLPPSASGLTFIEEVPGGSGLEFVQQGSSGGMKVVQEIPASSSVQMVPLPSGGNIIVFQVPANSQGVKVIQLPSFPAPSGTSFAPSSSRPPQSSSSVSNLDDVVKETPSPETTSDKDVSKPPILETPESSLNNKKGRESDSSSMVLIPAGYFNMGSPDGKGNSDEHPQHKVWVGAFYMDRYLVTFDQYDKFCENTGRDPVSDNGWGRGKNPVINIKWGDAEAFCKWAGKRLPTEAEWERAARGGTDTAYFFGDSENQLKDYAWYADDSGDKTQPVGLKQPNSFGLYDIVGDVWQWVSDWYAQNYYSQSPGQNPTGPTSGEYRVLRGGSWNINADYLESAHRGMDEPDHQDNSDGCRCAKSR